jgi:predicted transposase YbfD/YdcC
MNASNTASIIEHFSIVHDPRLDRNKEHRLIDIIAVTICAVICGADTFVGVSEYGKTKKDFLKTFLLLPSDIPSHDTFGRTFSLLNPEEFQKGFLSWVNAVHRLTEGEVIAIDGKTIRRAYEKDGNPLHIVSAFATANGMTIGQRATDKKSNEITAIPKLLKTLQLQGCIITIDAMGCQREIAQTILEGGGDYVLAVKGNQKTIYEDIQALFAEQAEQRYAGDSFKTIEKNAARHEVRICRTITDERLLPIGNYHRYSWPGLNSLVQVASERTMKGTTTTEIRYYLSSLDGNAEQLLSAVRSHWAIENKLHWSLDVSFREDESRVRAGYAQENFNIVRKIALGLITHEATAKVGVATKRLKAGWDESYLLRVLHTNKLRN